MKKAAVRHDLNKLKINYPLDFEGINVNCVKLYLDMTNPDEVLKIIKSNRAKFIIIIREILQGFYNNALYKKEGGNVTAMRFSGHPNSRIYCLEISGKGGEKKIVIMAKGIIHKNVQANDKKIIDSIKAINDSTYVYFEKYEDYEKYKKGI
ncbi:MAG TPA: hypothetical protein PLI68_11295 [Bacteroidia bacterium]|nr:hypothetical protein [Bacteroidia bacterium]